MTIETPVSTTVYRIAIATGAVLGFAVTMATRPSVLGEPVPLHLLFSSVTEDQIYRDALSTHLVWGSLGIMLSLVLLLALAERLVFGSAPVKTGSGFAAIGPANLNRYLVAAFGGAVFGLANAMFIRPTVVGMPIPLEALFSSNPADAPFRTALLGHLGLAALVGLVLSLALVVLVERLIATPGNAHA